MEMEAQVRLKDKTAIVTGAARGIGRAIAERYVAEGAKVLLSDIDAAELKTVADGLGMPYGAADASLKTDAEKLVRQAVETFGRLDIMVSNAGVTNKAAEFLDLAEEEFDRVLRINLKSQFVCGQAAARQMVAQGGGGVIINMSSVNARLAIPTLLPYVVSKAGSTQLTNVMAIALSEHNIRVNAIGPGTILTELGRGAVLGNEEARVRALSRTPLRRFGEPSEVAGVAVFLATDDSSYITGQTIYQDGGRMGLNYTVPVK
jgi:NAD(P)-dependent dehydrogenase (short-subunit alcohol dehydrogenase family)